MIRVRAGAAHPSAPAARGAGASALQRAAPALFSNLTPYPRAPEGAAGALERAAPALTLMLPLTPAPQASAAMDDRSRAGGVAGRVRALPRRCAPSRPRSEQAGHGALSASERHAGRAPAQCGLRGVRFGGGPRLGPQELEVGLRLLHRAAAGEAPALRQPDARARVARVTGGHAPAPGACCRCHGRTSPNRAVQHGLLLRTNCFDRVWRRHHNVGGCSQATVPRWEA